jgi:hypothetical protein
MFGNQHGEVPGRCLRANEHYDEIITRLEYLPSEIKNITLLRHSFQFNIVAGTKTEKRQMRYRRSSRVWRSSRPPPWLPIPAVPPISRIKQQVAFFLLFTFTVTILVLIHIVGSNHGRTCSVESWWNWNGTRIARLQHTDRSNDNCEHSSIFLLYKISVANRYLFTKPFYHNSELQP